MIYLDLECTGLDVNRHQVWEMGWAVDDGPIYAFLVPHHIINADPKALEIGRYVERQGWRYDTYLADQMERTLFDDLQGQTIVGANPAYDTAMLRSRWGLGAETPWHYRLLDIEAYAAGILGHVLPQGLLRIAEELRNRGHEIPEPDHSADGDVACLRACHYVLRDMASAPQTDAYL